MRKFLKILATVLTVAGTIVLLGFADSEHHNLQCQAVDITVLNPGDGALITVEEIMSLLTGDSRPLTGRRIESLDLYRMERALTENPYIATAEVYATIDGLLVVEVSLRYPIIRVINSKDQQGFIDREGVLVPLSDKHLVSLPVANGFIFEEFSFGLSNEIPVDSLGDRSPLRMVYEAGLVISRDEFLKAMIEQVYVNANQKMELVPQLGRQIILLGDGSNLEGKFLKLKAFYKDEMDKNRWATYSTIDIQYKNQIVCTKY